MSAKFRVVLDTNTVISALLFTNGRLSWLRAEWQLGVLVPLASKDTTRELLRVLTYPKFKLSAENQQDLLADYLPYAESVVQLESKFTKKISAVPVCRDPHDAMFLELAAAAQADFLVTGDDDLLVLAPLFHVPIITPAKLSQTIIS
jgi:uncharacterized protein